MELDVNTASEILQRLSEGNARFVADKVDGQLQDSQRRTALEGGQSPYAAIISCADSRVVPELAFDVGLGEIFVARVAGNVANTSTVASLEYAIAHLDTSVIVVLGHESCGAVTAAVQGADGGPNLDHLLGHIAPACEAAAGKPLADVVKKNAALAAEQLVERSAILREAVQQGRLTIVSAYYELGSGRVTFAPRPGVEQTAGTTPA